MRDNLESCLEVKCRTDIISEDELKLLSVNESIRWREMKRWIDHHAYIEYVYEIVKTALRQNGYKEPRPKKGRFSWIV
jgi:hypothetical protein